MPSLACIGGMRGMGRVRVMVRVRVSGRGPCPVCSSLPFMLVFIASSRVASMSVTVTLMQATRKEAMNTSMKGSEEQTGQGTQKARKVIGFTVCLVPHGPRTHSKDQETCLTRNRGKQFHHLCEGQ
jgi:hypothetical protein